MAGTKKINLALQGGGALGAYTWGVLDRLLKEESLLIEGISGTSAGAINAAVLATGFVQGGREGARKLLETFWMRVGKMGGANPFLPFSAKPSGSLWNLDWSPGYNWFDLFSRVYSPYEFNPLNLNPLRDILEDLLDPQAMHACDKIKLFIATTHVESGQPRVFQGEELSVDVLLASTCIPFLFQAVEIDGEAYWDGGYMGNPAIWPLIYHCDSEDIVLVQINPIHRQAAPKAAHEIVGRLNEITFNSSLIAEMRAINFVKKLIAVGRLKEDEYKDLRIHLIYSPEEMRSLNASSKMNTSCEFFRYLHGIGYAETTAWLKAHWKDIGKHGTVDIQEKFLTGPKRLTRTKPKATPKAIAPKHKRTKKT